MKVLKEADEAIMRALGRQKAKGTGLRRATWVIEDGSLAHNALTGEVVQLDGAGDEPEMAARYYLVPESMDEARFVAEWRDILRTVLLPQRQGGWTILPTTACNARCPYCYEQGLPAHSMPVEVARKAVDAIAAQGRNPASITWFGGEPLLGASRIGQICRGLRGRGIAVESRIITNGYLFDQGLIEEAVGLWGLKVAQVTLDGDREAYNAIKGYVGACDDPFGRVMGNISLLCAAGVRVSVRMNVGEANFGSLEALVPKLAALGCEGLTAYCRPLYQELTEGSDERCARIEGLLEAHGLSGGGRGLAKLRVSACMADDGHSLVLDPLGGLAACEHYAMRDLVGDLDGGVDAAARSPWEERADFPECRACPLMPSCVHLSRCPASRPCSPFEAARRIGQVKASMRALLDGAPASPREDDADADAPAC